MSGKTDHTQSGLESPELVDVLKLFPRGSKPTEGESASKQLLDEYLASGYARRVSFAWWMQNRRKSRHDQLFGSDTSSDEGKNLHDRLSDTTPIKDEDAVSQPSDNGMSSEGIEAACRSRFRDSLARDRYTSAAKAVAHKALADDNQLDAWDLENLLTVALRIKSPGKLNSYVLVNTFLILSLDEDFDTLREEIASAFYDEVDRKPRSSELPEMRISYDVRMTESSMLIRETLNRELHRLNEQVKQRKLGAIIAIMPDENPERAKSQDTTAHKNGGKPTEGAAVY